MSLGCPHEAACRRGSAITGLDDALIGRRGPGAGAVAGCAARLPELVWQAFDQAASAAAAAAAALPVHGSGAPRGGRRASATSTTRSVGSTARRRCVPVVPRRGTARREHRRSATPRADQVSVGSPARGLRRRYDVYGRSAGAPVGVMGTATGCCAPATEPARRCAGSAWRCIWAGAQINNRTSAGILPPPGLRGQAGMIARVARGLTPHTTSVRHLWARSDRAPQRRPGSAKLPAATTGVPSSDRAATAHGRRSTPTGG